MYSMFLPRRQPLRIRVGERLGQYYNSRSGGEGLCIVTHFKSSEPREPEVGADEGAPLRLQRPEEHGREDLTVARQPCLKSAF